MYLHFIGYTLKMMLSSETLTKKRIKFLVQPLLAGFSILFCLRQFTQQILLFESILLSIIITILFNVWLIWARRKKQSEKFVYEDFLAITLSLVLFYSISASTVLNVDRSKSFYVISWVHDLGPISEKNLALKLRTRYGEYDSISIHQRLLEQKARGIFIVEDDLYQTSILGNIYWHAANGIASVFNLSGWYSAKLPK